MKIQTVLGAISPENLGRTLTHEHLHLDVTWAFQPGPKFLETYINNRITLSNVGLIRNYPYGCRDNLNMADDECKQAVANDLRLYKKWGGGGIVENSSHGLHANWQFVREVSRESNVHIIHGTGHYMEIVQPESVKHMSIEDLSNLYTNDILVGVEYDSFPGDPIKCGAIGEVASDWPITDFEKRAIQASGITSESINCGVTFHPGERADAPFEIVRLFLEAGGKPNKCIMSHIDRTIHDMGTLLEFAKLGIFCQMDFFGLEAASLLQSPVKFLTDLERIDRIVELCREGLADQITVSHDVHSKHRLIHFGGHGYSHIINNIIPVFLNRGLTQEQIDQITIKNPANWLEMPI